MNEIEPWLHPGAQSLSAVHGGLNVADAVVIPGGEERNAAVAVGSHGLDVRLRLELTLADPFTSALRDTIFGVHSQDTQDVCAAHRRLDDRGVKDVAQQGEVLGLKKLTGCADELGSKSVSTSVVIDFSPLVDFIDPVLGGSANAENPPEVWIGRCHFGQLLLRWVTDDHLGEEVSHCISENLVSTVHEHGEVDARWYLITGVVAPTLGEERGVLLSGVAVWDRLKALWEWNVWAFATAAPCVHNRCNDAPHRAQILNLGADVLRLVSAKNGQLRHDAGGQC